MEESVLYMPVNAEWFKLIKSGVKRVEYREIKAHWIARLFLFVKIWPDGKTESHRICKQIAMKYEKDINSIKIDIENGKLIPRYSQVEFSEGYPKKDDEERRARYKLVSITIDYPKKSLCPDEFLNNEYLNINFE